MRDTKDKILDVAEDLIQRVGLNAMSYKHISELVGIRKASIHHHFQRKEHLVNEILERCRITYGDNYRRIVAGDGSAPEKLRALAGVFEDGLMQQKLCVVGTISSDLNTLKEHSCRILETTINGTVEIFSIAFEQGRTERSLEFKGTDRDAAYAFFSFLLGAQIATRVHGGQQSFHNAVEAIISSWES